MAHEYIYVDLETTVHGGPDGDSPEAHWPNNHVLLSGFQAAPLSVHISDSLKKVIEAIQLVINRGHTPVIVAHNAKFDIKHLMRYTGWCSQMWKDCKVWCTMTYDYLDSGHVSKFTSLEDLCRKHKLVFNKSLDLGALLDAGVQMEDIDKTQLRDYLHEDVFVLKEVHEKQLLTGRVYDMDYILPLCEMELNGLRIDKQAAELEFINLAQIVNEHERTMRSHIKQSCIWQDGSDVIDDDFSDAIGTKSKYIKTHAGRTLSMLLTGTPHELNITAKWKLRFKNMHAPYHRAAGNPTCYKKPTHLGFPIDEVVLEKDKNWITHSASKHRGANKLLGTYLSPMLEVLPLTGGTVHPKLNTCVTATGRLSSSQPNGQNMPPHIRKLVIPSAQANHIYEIDFKQLEMVAVAIISGCKAMIAAINRGDDLHYLSGKTVYGWSHPSDMSDDARKVVKAVNFGVLYGGKAAGLSHQTGVDKAIIQRLIDGFYTNFPGVAAWQKATFEEVVDKMKPYDTKEGVQRYGSMWTLPLTGRRFQFTESEAPRWLQKKTNRKWSFSPTQTSNYPIQGCAGGDLVMFALSWLYKNYDLRYLLTVHDSIVVESVRGRHEIELIVTDMCAAIKYHYNLPLDLHCDVDRGTTWK